MVVPTYEVYLWVEKIFHEWAQQTNEIFFPQEDKVHMFNASQRVIEGSSTKTM